MISVQYMYLRKEDDSWQDGENSFDYPENAVRFIYKLKRSPIHIYLGFKCDTYSEHEFITRRVKF